MLPLDELLKLLIEHILDFLEPKELGELGGVCRDQAAVSLLLSLKSDITNSLEGGKE